MLSAASINTAIWARVTDGLQVQELWGQFKSEARESYQLYSKDVDWEAVKQEPSKFKRWWRSVCLVRCTSHPNKRDPPAAISPTAAAIADASSAAAIRLLESDTNTSLLEYEPER